MFGNALGSAMDKFEEKTGVDIPDDLEEEACDAADEALDLKDICGDEVAPLTNAQETFGSMTKDIGGHEQGLGGLQNLGGGGMVNTDGVNKLAGLANAFKDKITEVVGGQGGGALGCLVDCYANSIKSALQSLGREVVAIEEKVKGFPDELSAIVTKVLDKLKEVVTTIMSGLAKLKELPGKAVALIEGCFEGDPKEAPQKLGDLPDGLDGISGELKGAIDGMDFGGLSAAKGEMSGLGGPIDELSRYVGGFLETAPGKVESAFSPPGLIGCCLSEVVPDGIEEGKEKLMSACGMMTKHGASFQLLRSYVTMLQSRLDGVDLDGDSLKAKLMGLADNFDAAIAPVRGASEKCKSLIGDKLGGLP